jgi:hypothetical protein
MSAPQKQRTTIAAALIACLLVTCIVACRGFIFTLRELVSLERLVALVIACPSQATPKSILQIFVLEFTPVEPKLAGRA